MTNESKKPEAKFRIGSVSATVWKNENGYYRTEIIRNYKKDDAWKTSSSFSHDELLAVTVLASRAEAWIADQQ